jgi:hypothetical protein
MIHRRLTNATQVPFRKGPLHTRANNRDHELVRAQKKVSEGCPKTPPKSCRVVTDPQG